ncbi:MAG: type II toxin-antitoxin system HicB family antitoxin [Burkholderiaceae bacterium]|nr:type II toxin-antitoxin system HicB family antitoxin [Burkholderiaceae bacterium]
MDLMSYKGYFARLEYSAEDHLLVGHLAGTRDIVGFHGSSVDELECAFHEAVDDYLNACAQLNQAPNRPSFGRMTLRVDPDLHARADTAARRAGKSLSQWVAGVFARELNRHS